MKKVKYLGTTNWDLIHGKTYDVINYIPRSFNIQSRDIIELMNENGIKVGYYLAMGNGEIMFKDIQEVRNSIISEILL